MAPPNIARDIGSGTLVAPEILSCRLSIPPRMSVPLLLAFAMNEIYRGLPSSAEVAVYVILIAPIWAPPIGAAPKVSVA